MRLGHDLNLRTKILGWRLGEVAARSVDRHAIKTLTTKKLGDRQTDKFALRILCRHIDAANGMHHAVLKAEMIVPREDAAIDMLNIEDIRAFEIGTQKRQKGLVDRRKPPGFAMPHGAILQRQTHQCGLPPGRQ